MQEYEFTLKFNFTDVLINPESYLDNLAQVGCDDALIGIGQKGRIALNFNREAESALSALYSAIEQVKSVFPMRNLLKLRLILSVYPILPKLWAIHGKISENAC